MSDNYRVESGGSGPKSSGAFRCSRRTWMVWLAVLCGIVLLLLFKEGLETQADRITQHQLEELVDAGQVVHATVAYDGQNPALNKVAGTYAKVENGAKREVPFRTTVRLTPSLEQKLLSLPQVEPYQPNTFLLSVVWSVLPIVVIAALIWFFFIRQIRLAAKSAPGSAEVQARTLEQQSRFDKILDKWEEQARRMDAVLDKMERDANGRG
ncbi:MAG: ATP-dependent metallopeptidase FtsH/Yme1/Tma family protein [Verrucomicrobiota bacterium]